MEEIKKSFKSILYERTTSPFYGTFIISWLIWNWKIVYVTLFVAEKSINTNKLSYLIHNYLIDKNNLILRPIISTIILLTIFPFVVNGSYWLKLKFDKWKIDKKNEVQLKLLLTLEQSIELREQIANQEERFEKILSDKNIKIIQLEQMIKPTSVVKDSEQEEDKGNFAKDILELFELKEKIISNESSISTYHNLVRYIQGGWRVDMEKTPASFLALMESHDIIKPAGSGVYKWGENGSKFHKLISK